MSNSGSEKPRGKSDFNEAIGGLRGLAAFIVVLYHLPLQAYSVGLIRSLPTGLVGRLYDASGKYAVCLFFCISGYLITSTLVKHGRISTFAKNRVVRIMPLYTLITVVLFTVGVFANYRWLGELKGHPGLWLLHFASNMLFLPGVFDLPIAQHVGWSLSYEFFFYIFAAIGYSLFKGDDATKSHPNRLLRGIFLLVVAASICLRPLGAFFVVGFLALRLQENLSTSKYIRISGFGELLIGFLMFSIAPILATPFVFVGFSSILRRDSLIYSALSLKPLTFLGKISYSLYLVHPIALDLMRKIASRVEPKLGAMPSYFLFCVVGTAFAVLFGFLSYNLVEVKLTNAIFKRPGPNPVLKPAQESS